MHETNSPFVSSAGREQMFWEAQNLVEGTYADAPVEAKMRLIGELVSAHAQLISAQRHAEWVEQAINEVATAIRDAGEK